MYVDRFTDEEVEKLHNILSWYLWSSNSNQFIDSKNANLNEGQLWSMVRMLDDQDNDGGWEHIPTKQAKIAAMQERRHKKAVETQKRREAEQKEYDLKQKKINEMFADSANAFSVNTGLPTKSVKSSYNNPWGVLDDDGDGSDQINKSTKTKQSADSGKRIEEGGYLYTSKYINQQEKKKQQHIQKQQQKSAANNNKQKSKSSTTKKQQLTIESAKESFHYNKYYETMRTVEAKYPKTNDIQLKYVVECLEEYFGQVELDSNELSEILLQKRTDFPLCHFDQKFVTETVNFLEKKPIDSILPTIMFLINTLISILKQDRDALKSSGLGLMVFLQIVFKYFKAVPLSMLDYYKTIFNPNTLASLKPNIAALHLWLAVQSISSSIQAPLAIYYTVIFPIKLTTHLKIPASINDLLNQYSNDLSEHIDEKNTKTELNEQTIKSSLEQFIWAVQKGIVLDSTTLEFGQLLLNTKTLFSAKKVPQSYVTVLLTNTAIANEEYRDRNKRKSLSKNVDINDIEMCSATCESVLRVFKPASTSNKTASSFLGPLLVVPVVIATGLFARQMLCNYDHTDQLLQQLSQKLFETKIFMFWFCTDVDKSRLPIVLFFHCVTNQILAMTLASQNPPQPTLTNSRIERTWDDLKFVISQGRLHELGRKDVIQSEMKNHSKWVSENYNSMKDYILYKMFDFELESTVEENNDNTSPNQLHSTKKKKAVIPDIIEQKIVFKKNDFPYNCEKGINHMVLWCLKPMTDEQAKKYITENLNLEFGKDYYKRHIPLSCGAGSGIGSACWDLFCKEKQYDWTNVDQHNQLVGDPFFSVNASGDKLVPRALFVDLSDDVLADIKVGHQRGLFNHQNILYNHLESGNIFSSARWNNGNHLQEPLYNRIRQLLEQCDRPEGVLFTRSVAGGTGSGLTSMIMSHIQNEYPKLADFDFPIFSFGSTLDPIVEPYNTLLSCVDMLEGGLTIPIDNQSLFRICQEKLGVRYPTFQNLNRIVAQVISILTLSKRHPSPGNIDLQEFITGLVPYPKLHFLSSSFTPFINKQSNSHDLQTTQSLTDSIINPSNTLLDPRNGNPFGKSLFLSCCFYYRGDFNILDIRDHIDQRLKHRLKFVEWAPSGIKVGVNGKAKCTLDDTDIIGEKAVCMLANSTSIANLFQRVVNRFNMLYRRRSYVCHFLGEGMSSREFAEAEMNIHNMCLDYKEIAEI
ncbi:hypothetical protein PPL_00520 [Heterostelium album PN500]|uniref:Tubulin/FtsZ GTPase domain-containing protein n=1 Tax=Heterostelium pallidum (strain ATCC 26659 / Pp 5 / PN500) TaxID=670386 RepID=D3AWP3_HETP5|nr:hypothetical protein PPL_00520 [Heterostelium album PN500]EFA86716.1 hypothetical protein PPL_00520 [Heterostelium album PN500]|eukprot:XP_020438820.1 hypothetical protein PPL_00520 [Heterostelium album PN500]